MQRMLLVRRKLSLIHEPSDSVEMHIIGTERRARVRSTCSAQYLNNMSDGKSLTSTSSQGEPQNNELTREPNELVQHFRLGEVHMGARALPACPKFDTVWLYYSPFPVGRRGVISSFKWFLLRYALRKGRGVGTLWAEHQIAPDHWKLLLKNKDDIFTRLYTDRLSNRLLMALSRESENSEDGSLRLQVNQAADRLKAVIAPFVESSKTMAINMADQVQKNI